MEDKISIILPIFNVEAHLRAGINSLIKQTIGNENLEIIMVDDCSTDNSGKIIDEYAEKYDCCVAIHHEKNSGGAHTPRNTGIKACTGDYIMFLDPDDTYSLDTCETLYNTIKKYDADISFGRFRIMFPHTNNVQLSFSPYKDNIEEIYCNEHFDKSDSQKISFINKKIDNYLYGKTYNIDYSTHNPNNVIYTENIENETSLLLLAPAIWSKIYKRELLIDNNLCFQQFISGDDLAFSLESFLHAKGIVFLNDFLAYNYYIRDLPDDKSLTNNINIRLLLDLLESFIYCAKCTSSFSKETRICAVNNHMPHWFSLWKKSNLSKAENEEIIQKLSELRKIHNVNFRTKVLFSILIKYIKFKG